MHKDDLRQITYMIYCSFSTSETKMSLQEWYPIPTDKKETKVKTTGQLNSDDIKAIANELQFIQQRVK